MSYILLMVDYTPTLENTGYGLRYKREQLGLTRTAAAKQAGINRQDITRIEAGAPGISWGKVFAYMRCLDVQLPKVIIASDASMLDLP